jgi:deazaflavin-dependent oxidoreductase (nitroreductase family)
MRLSAMAIHDEPPYLYLTTIGRRTGGPREIEIWFTQRNDRHYVISEQYDQAQWVRNIQVDPHVRWRVGAEIFTGRARMVDSATESELMEAVQTGSWMKYGWGEGLIVELTPDRTD